MPTPIDPKRIRIDLDTQSRVTLNEDVVKEYAEAMEAGNAFPAILVFYDELNDQFILADGFHRFAAHMKVKPNDPILAEQRLGTVEDARWESIGANKSHGLRRTNEDKHNAVKQALLHPKGTELSDRKIAEHVGVHHDTVGRIRRELELSGGIRQIETRTVQRGSQTYQQNTSRIGFGKEKIPQDAACLQCRYFEDNRCINNGSEPLPWQDACEDFAVKVEEKPRLNIPPPDYDHIVFSGLKEKSNNSSSPHQYRRLKGCLTVYLPSDNPTLFAIELRNRWTPEYLTACIAALKHLLTDNDD